MQDRILHPVLLQFRHSQPLKELFLSKEICFQGADEQTFPESARPGKKIVISFLYHFVHQRGLVNIHATVIAEFLEILYSYRIKHITSQMSVT